MLPFAPFISYQPLAPLMHSAARERVGLFKSDMARVIRRQRQLNTFSSPRDSRPQLLDATLGVAQQETR